MCRKRSAVTNLVIFVSLSLVLAACDAGVRVGDLQTKSQTVGLDNTNSVDVEIQMGAGELVISGGASELLEASFIYNVEELNPHATYSDGRLEVKDIDVKEGIRSLFDLDEYRNEWDLRFNESVPMEMNIDLGAGRSDLSLGALAVTGLNIDGGAGDVNLNLNGSRFLSRLDFTMGAGEVTVDLTGEWQNDLDARLEGGLGEITVKLPSNIGVRIDVQTGIGGVNASGLSKNGNTYTNDAYGVSGVTLRIDVESGVGQINLEPDKALSGSDAGEAVDELSVADCPEAVAGAKQLIDASRGVCLLYPANFDAFEYGDGLGYTLFISSLMGNHQSPVVWITFEAADGLSLEEVTSQRMAEYAFPDTQSQAITLGSEPASMLDNLPGQDTQRRIVAIHEDLVVDIVIDHIGKNYGTAGEQAEAAYSMIIGSFKFVRSEP